MIPRRYLNFVNVVLIFCLLAGGGYVAWLLFVPSELADEVAITLSPHEKKNIQAVAPGQAYYEIVTQRNLWEAKFKPPEDRPPPSPPPPPAPPPKLELKGTSVSDNPDKSWAIIEDLLSKTQKIYRMGDIIRGWQVIEIDRTEVTIENNGRREVLRSFKDQIPVPSGVLRYSRVYRKLKQNRWLVSRQGLWQLVNKKIWEKMQEPPDNFRLVPEDVIGALSTVGCRLYYPPQKRKQGPASGYEIVILPREHLAYKLGIREGDIVEKINDLKITGKQQAMDILLEVQGEDLVVVQVERGGKDMMLEYVIQEKELTPVDK